jgi:hypothetical protein
MRCVLAILGSHSNVPSIALDWQNNFAIEFQVENALIAKILGDLLLKLRRAVVHEKGPEIKIRGPKRAVSR